MENTYKYDSIEDLQHDYVVIRDHKITALRNGDIIEDSNDLIYRTHDKSTYVYLDDELVAKFDDK